MDKVIDGVYPQTNYTTQQFYTKEEYDKLQAENEELKKLCDNKDELLISATRKSVELQAENEQLKADIESRTMCITCERELQNCNLQAENERLKEEITKLSDPRYQISKVNEGYYNRMNTYKQALQEIRELIKKLDLSLGVLAKKQRKCMKLIVCI